MPNNNNKSKNRRARRGSSNQIIVRECGSGTVNFTIAAAALSDFVPLSPEGLSTFVTRFGELMEAYQLFRFTKIVLTYQPREAVSSIVNVVFGYSPGEPTIGTLSPSAATSQFRYMRMVSTYLQTHSSLVVPRVALITGTPNKWWRTQTNASIEVWEEQQGEIFCSVPSALAAQQVFSFQLYYELELSGQIAPSLIPRPIRLSKGLQALIDKAAANQFKASLPELTTELKSSMLNSLTQS